MNAGMYTLIKATYCSSI